MRDCVPYITLREGEREVTDDALILRYGGGSASLGIAPAAGLAYADERAGDRDHHGVLYTRVTEHLDAAGWPAGKPDWAHVHPARQREAMGEMFCHYCKGEPSRTGAGLLFLDVAGEQEQARPQWPEGIVTYQPPLCLPHAKKAADLCGHGRRNGGFTAFRAQQLRWHGVLGTPYQDSAGRPRPTRSRAARDTDVIPFHHPQRGLFLGSQYALALHGVTVTDLDAELSAAGLT